MRGRLWRASNPGLTTEQRGIHTHALMDARRAVRTAQQHGDARSQRSARQRFDAAKRALGERGPPWGEDGAPDWNRHLARNTPYREWFENLEELVTKA